MPEPDVPSESPPAPPRPWTRKRILTSASWPVLGVLALPFAARFCGSCMGYEGLVMQQVNQCPRATYRLGEPITESYAGLSCGTVETEDDDGHASWRMPVSGPKGSGVYRFEVVEKGGVWSVAESTLDVGDERIEVRGCAFAARGEGVSETRELRGRVLATTGPAPAVRDATCVATIAPGAGRFGCRVVITCGVVTLYGARPTSGFTGCEVQRGPDGREAITAIDRPSDPSSDPNLDLHTATGVIDVDERRQAIPWSVRIRLDDAPPAPASP